jgi:hypothetical protein
MVYKVGALIIKDDCLLLTVKTNILGTKYDFPIWSYEQGEIPIEAINKRIKNLGIKKDDKSYITRFVVKNKPIFLYKIKKWEGKIKAPNYIWVHKSVLMMNKRSLPFDTETMNEIF